MDNAEPRRGRAPGTIYFELERIRLSHDGKLRPPDVVEAARPKTSALHPHFTWDDKEAANEHRLWQARQLIRTVEVIVDDRRMPGYVNVPADVRVNSYYRPVEIVVASPDEFQRALEQLYNKLAGAQNALESLKYAAKSSPNPDQRMAMINLAAEAFSAAAAAVRQIQ